MAENDDNAGRQSQAGSSYVDHSRVAVNAKSPPSQVLIDAGKKCRGLGSNFPAKLHKILSDPQHAEIIAWMPHGRSWKVLRPGEFIKTVATKYFAFSKFSSFLRQVNGWGFKRLTQGRDENSYYHELFLRGLPHLLKWMRRPSKLVKLRRNEENEPDFYEIWKESPLPEIASYSPKHNDSSAISTLTARPHGYHRSQKQQTITAASPPQPARGGHANRFAINQEWNPSSSVNGAELRAPPHQEAPHSVRTSISPTGWWHLSEAEILQQHEAGQVNSIVDNNKGHSWGIGSFGRNVSPQQQQRQVRQLPVSEKPLSSYAQRRPCEHGPTTLSPPEPLREKDSSELVPLPTAMTEQHAQNRGYKASDTLYLKAAGNCKEYESSFHQQNTAFGPPRMYNKYKPSSVEACPQYEPKVYPCGGDGNIFADDQQPPDPIIGKKSSRTAVSSEWVNSSPDQQRRQYAFSTFSMDNYDAGRDTRRGKNVTSTCAVEENPFLRILDGEPPNMLKSVSQHSAEPAHTESS